MGFFRRLLGGPSADGRSQAAPSSPTGRVVPPPFMAEATWLQWPTIAWGSLHSVAGESHRQPGLEQVVGSLSGSPPIRLATAQLVREPRNPKDRDAVRVEVGGIHVGYLPRDLAPLAHRLVDSLHQSGRPATCRAEITGGVGEKTFLGLTLHVDNPWAPLIEGTPFLDGSRFTSVTVTKEERYQEPLEALLAIHGDAPLTADLRTGPDGMIDVHAGGPLVGHLTAKMTERHSGTLRVVREAGFPCTCLAKLRRDEKAIIQVSLSLLSLPT